MTILTANINYPPIILTTDTGGLTDLTIDAISEKVEFIGQIHLEDPAGLSKTISSAGGKIHWITGTPIVFADVGTTLRIGIQDVGTALATPGGGDTTFDVHGDLIGGTDTIVANSTQITTMGSGTKTIANGDKISVILELQSRGGTDSVKVGSYEVLRDNARKANWPYVTLNSAAQTVTPTCVIEFDDGTIGWLEGTWLFANEPVAVSYDVATTPDEYGNYISVPMEVTCSGIYNNFLLSGDASDFELILYSDPLGVPIAEKTIIVDASQTNQLFAGGQGYFMFDSPFTLEANTAYAITMRPTTATNISCYYQDVADVNHWKVSGVEDTESYALSRTDNTGIFADFNAGTAKTRRVSLSAIISGITASAGGAGGVGAFVSNNDSAFDWLRAQGFTGTYNDMLKKFLAST